MQPTVYTGQEILEAYKEDMAMHALERRRLLARIAELEKENATLRAGTATEKADG